MHITGKVKFWNQKRGFGFITKADGSEVYFTSASLPRGRRYDPVEGDEVSFEEQDARKGPMAVRIEQAGA